ncbi:MAG: DUF2807 domain-containing protein [Chitinophagaceae bacterium]|nr:MAG: DUF2807 domain-containing protein [Chitinophagaceae bacterium]
MYKLILGLALAFSFFSCEKEKRDCPSSSEKTFVNTGFTRISAGETFNLTIKQGAAFSIKAKGCSNDLNDLVVSEQNGVLTIRYNRHESGRYRVDFDITLPALSSIALDGAATANLTGFSQQAINLKTVLNGSSKCTVNDLPVLLSAELSGTSVLTVAGTASDLIAHLSGAANLHAYGARFTDADVYTSGTAKAQVQVQTSLAALASGDSRIYYKGAPTSVNIEQSGTAKVIHE